MNILFLNVGRRCELVEAFKKSLCERNGGLIYGSDISINAPGLYSVNHSVILPHSSSSEFIDVVSSFCIEKKIDLLIPTIDPDLVFLDKYRDELKDRCPDLRLLLSPSFTIQHSRDKRLSRLLFKKLGAHVPQSISKMPPQMKFPVFVKPFNGSAGIGAQVVSTYDEFITLVNQNSSLMIEEVIHGPEYTVDVLCDFKGRPLFSVARKRIKVRGGEVCQGVIERNEILEELAKNLAAGFNCQGPVTLQFRSPEQGQFVAMELNARMGGGLPLTIAGGASWPGWILDLCNDAPPNINVTVTDKLLMTRYDSSFFIKESEVNSNQEKTKYLTDIKGIIVDMDDTLYPERDFVFSGYRAVSQHVFDDSGIEIESRLRMLFNAGMRGDLFSNVLRHYKLEFDENYILKLVWIYRTHIPFIRPFIDIQALKQLRNNGILLGLLSDGWLSVQQNKLDALGIKKLFTSVVFSDALGGRKFWKPSLGPYALSLRNLNLKAAEVIYIGDNPKKDFSGANKLGIKTVRIRRNGSEYEKFEAVDEKNKPLLEIESLSELRRVLNQPDFKSTEFEGPNPPKKVSSEIQGSSGIKIVTNLIQNDQNVTSIYNHRSETVP